MQFRLQYRLIESSNKHTLGERDGVSTLNSRLFTNNSTRISNMKSYMRIIFFVFISSLFFSLSRRDMAVRKKGYGKENQPRNPWKCSEKVREKERNWLLYNVDLLVIWIKSISLTLNVHNNLVLFFVIFVVVCYASSLISPGVPDGCFVCIFFFFFFIFILRSSIKRLYILNWIHKMLKKFQYEEYYTWNRGWYFRSWTRTFINITFFFF